MNSLLSLGEVARNLAITRGQVRQLVAEGKLPPIARINEVEKIDSRDPLYHQAEALVPAERMAYFGLSTDPHSS